MIDWYDMHDHFLIFRQLGHDVPMVDFHTHLARDEIILVLDGHSTIVTESNFTQLSGSYVIFYPRGVPHYQSNDPAYDYRHYQLCYRPEMLSGFLPPERIPCEFFVARLDEASLSRLEKYMSLLFSTKADSPSERLDTERQYLIALVLNELEYLPHEQLSEEKPSVKPVLDQLIREICRYISENLNRELKLDEIAGHFYISRAKLVRVFRQMAGVTVNDYILVLRIARARRMLAGELSLSEIAERCGFSSVSYFIKVFGREVGTTPAKYRESLRSD